MLVIILAIILVVIILYFEYRTQDCINGKNCRSSVLKPEPTDDNLTYLDKIYRLVKNTYHYVIWRQALLVGIIVSLPVVYYLTGRLPTLMEFAVVSGLIFIGCYMASSWLWTHFFYPNAQQIEKKLMNLRDRINLKN